MAGASITKSVVCANCGRPVDKTKIQARNAGLFCDACAAGMRGGQAKEEERNCPACGIVVPMGTSLCKSCGFDYELGYSPKAVEKQTTVKRYKPPCVHCGYDRSGMGDDEPCPECSKKNKVRKTVKEKEALERAKAQLRPMGLEIGLVVGLMLASVGVLCLTLWSVGELDRLAICVTRIGVRYVLLASMVVMSLFLFVENDLSLGRILWRLVGVACVVYAGEEFFWTVGQLVCYPFTTVLLIAVLHRNLELEWSDAGILGFLHWLFVFLTLPVMNAIVPMFQ